jgi:hypothetical protein
LALQYDDDLSVCIGTFSMMRSSEFSRFCSKISPSKAQNFLWNGNLERRVGLRRLGTFRTAPFAAMAIGSSAAFAMR